MWKTAFKTFAVIWSAQADHITSIVLKAVFHKFYLVHSWILCPTYSFSLFRWYQSNNEPEHNPNRFYEEDHETF